MNVKCTEKLNPNENIPNLSFATPAKCVSTQPQQVNKFVRKKDTKVVKLVVIE